MKKVFIILAGIFAQTISAQAETTIYLIRHAEKADGSPDTELSEQGKKRAANWALYFKDIPLEAIYSTPYARTRTTGLPTATFQQKEIISYNPREMDLKEMVKKYSGKAILIVGHSNTIPGYVNQFLGEEKYPEIPESGFGNLYIIKISDAVISDTLVRM